MALAENLDPVSRMFRWWNEAYKTPGAYTDRAFGDYFTNDASLIIDGRVSASGLAALAAHFQKIQSGGGEVEIILPFEETFRQGDKVYTRHVIRAVRDGTSMRMLAAGHAVIRNEKIASISLVRTLLEPDQKIV